MRSLRRTVSVQMQATKLGAAFRFINALPEITVIPDQSFATEGVVRRKRAGSVLRLRRSILFENEMRVRGLGMREALCSRRC